MILNCSLCQKKFIVPDSAISEKGRLVQCSACGNKWTQYPEKTPLKETKINNEMVDKVIRNKNVINIKKIKKIKKKLETPYTAEYLKKKHGLKIKDTDENIVKKKSHLPNVGFGFYNYIITYAIIFITFYGILHLTRDQVNIYYPQSGVYLDYFFETINNFKLIVNNIISS